VRFRPDGDRAGKGQSRKPSANIVAAGHMPMISVGPASVDLDSPVRARVVGVDCGSYSLQSLRVECVIFVAAEEVANFHVPG
jgi:hypothetical protein